MRDTTKLYLLTGIGYGLIFAQRIPTLTYILGGLLLGMILTFQKIFLIQEQLQRNDEKMDKMMEDLYKDHNDWIDKWNTKIRKHNVKNEDQPTGSDSRNEDKT